MIAFILAAAATDPLLTELQEKGAPPPLTCPIDVVVEANGGDDQEIQRMRVDPTTEEVTLLDENGDPIAQEETDEEPEQDDEDGEGNTVSIDSTDYEDILELLDLPFERVEETEAGVLFRATDLPKGTVDLGDLDLSRRSQLELTVSEGEAGPFISAYRAELTRPMRVRVVARILSFESEIQYTEFDGQPRTQTQQLAASVSALGNRQEFSVNMDFSYPACDGEAL